MNDFIKANDISRTDAAAGAVLAGVILLLKQDPTLIAMANMNDEARFIEGCLADPTFPIKFANALMTVREAVAA